MYLIVVCLHHFVVVRHHTCSFLFCYRLWDRSGLLYGQVASTLWKAHVGGFGKYRRIGSQTYSVESARPSFVSTTAHTYLLRDCCIARRNSDSCSGDTDIFRAGRRDDKGWSPVLAMLFVLRKEGCVANKGPLASKSFGFSGTAMEIWMEQMHF